MPKSKTVTVWGESSDAVARASRRHPTLLAMLADGRLHVSGIERLRRGDLRLVAPLGESALARGLGGQGSLAGIYFYRQCEQRK